ncbi:transcriptional adapter 1 [Anaeramoeba ignava]|uniref:Transcriptional adapter 1 n=1 Tax=Anaeramoeba ignava TaxID=1746090 RepID=A0A9Q0REC1_ANAIG|nr:transcriptional adapter 1 [Anaeramoeba ignava]
MELQKINIQYFKKQLQDLLKTQFSEYWKHFQLLMKAEISIEELQTLLKKLLKNDRNKKKKAVRFHNRLIMSILFNANQRISQEQVGNITQPPYPTQIENTNENQMKVYSSHFISIREIRLDRIDQENSKMVHTRVIDLERIKRRMAFFAKEKGMERFSINSHLLVAKYLQSFLTKIITLANVTSKAPLELDFSTSREYSQIKYDFERMDISGQNQNLSENENFPKISQLNSQLNSQLYFQLDSNLDFRTLPSIQESKKYSSQKSNSEFDSPAESWLFSKQQQHQQHELKLNDLILAYDLLPPYFRISIKTKEKYQNSLMETM